MLTINQILQKGRYRIVGQLGQNGVGMGYEAFDNTLQTSVLLKEIPEQSGKVVTPAQLEARRASFAGKAKLLSTLRHEALLHVNDFFSEVDRHYLVTEFTDGRTLNELLEKKKSPFPLANVLAWADRLLDALNYLHTLIPPVIHHEVKPQNIRLSPDGRVKLLVFNIVKAADEQAKTPDVNQTFDAAVLPFLPLEQIWDGLDAASQKVILTNYDEASERILEQPLDARTDVYAFGATVYYLLTARVPADALTRSIEILEGKTDPLAAPAELNPAVPPEISDVVIKSLEIKRENRLSSAAIMRQLLRTALNRVREREARQEARPEDDAVLEIPTASPAPAAPKMPPAPRNPEIEAAHSQQLELIKQQLREAEERRLEAEARAADAEKRLLEAELHITLAPPSRDDRPVVEAAPVEPAPAAVAEDYDDFSGLFAEHPPAGGGFKKIAVAAVALIALGGAGFGVWSLTKSKNSPVEQVVSSSVTPAAEATPEPKPENLPASSYQTTATGPSAESNPTPENAAGSTAPKPKTAATAAPTATPAKKPSATPTPAKNAEKPKKVTLDDLLKEN
ncbi:MAG: serine/threonine protein kinase [Acidobacteria bacterium]|nr:serine/threonine protein kinase [Acidobacteriota bacterium]